ncbi:MAG: isocitrate lyase/phosphoenolpyruvate mutase family protein [Anaerolineae bacterium]|nr:isocitrate lyase/phosphoenolpyruvate mutase family protein [Anaerolineae bacterium]
MEQATQIALAKQFHALHHQTETLILPNAWDAGSAVIFEKTGFEAIGTTSAGIAYTLGYPDGEHIGLSELIHTERTILRRINLPLTVDVEAGYGTNPAAVAESVRAVIEVGAVGINLEDGLSGKALIPLEEQCNRIRALAALKAEMGVPFFINARTDVYWLSIGEAKDQLSMTLERCAAYVEAGADGAFVPGRLGVSIIRELVNMLDVPLNVIATPSNPTIAELQALGVARLSLGSGPVRAALGITQKIAAELHQQRSLASMFSVATPYDEMNRLFE